VLYVHILREDSGELRLHAGYRKALPLGSVRTLPVSTLLAPGWSAMPHPGSGGAVNRDGLHERCTSITPASHVITPVM
ncbi:hypothetical protein E4U61_003839, partial [Claviceps capensis]